MSSDQAKMVEISTDITEEKMVEENIKKLDALINELEEKRKNILAAPIDPQNLPEGVVRVWKNELEGVDWAHGVFNKKEIEQCKKCGVFYKHHVKTNTYKHTYNDKVEYHSEVFMPSCPVCGSTEIQKRWEDRW